MDVIKDKSDRQLLESLIAEIAKTQNEIRCAQGDLQKAQSRIRFLLVVAHELIERQRIER